MRNFAELADNRLYGCKTVVAKERNNGECKVCLNERAIVHLLDSIETKMAEPESFKNGA